MSATLEVRELSRSVGSRSLFERLSLTLHTGETRFITGPSGCGKTVLLRTLACLDALEAGEMRLEGRCPQEWGHPIWRRQVCWIPQQAPALLGSRERDTASWLVPGFWREVPPRSRALCAAEKVGATDPDPVIRATVGGNIIAFPYDFALGQTDVVWRATDDSGNVGTDTQQVRVRDTTAPTVTAGAQLVVEATDPAGTPLTPMLARLPTSSLRLRTEGAIEASLNRKAH